MHITSFCVAAARTTASRPGKETEMKHRTTYVRRLAPAVVAASLLAGGVSAQTGGKTKSEPLNPVTGQEKPLGAVIQVPVAVSLKTDKKTYAPNEPIKMTISVKNTTKQTVKLPFANGQRYDIEIRRGKEHNGEKVWQWAHGKMFTMMLSTLPVPPGKAVVFTETYDPAKEKPLSPGTYTITATVTTRGRTPRPYDIETITVK